jgi:drug/metabolite transporter (DMT)-like permease
MAAVWYAVLCLIWGSTWLVIKVGYGGLGPFTVAALRFLLAGALLTPMVPALGARWPRGRAEWALVVFIGIVLFGFDYGLIYWAEQFLDSGLTAILFAVLPLLTIACAHVYLPGDRMTPRKLSGALLAFAGVVLLFGDRVQVDAAATRPMLAVLGSALCAALAAVASKRHGANIHPAALNAPAMLVGSAVLFVLALAAGEDVGLPRDGATWGAVAYLAIAGSIVTFLVYFALLKTWSVTSLSFISVFTPAIALALGFVVLDERPTGWTAAGAGFILAGVTLALTSRKRQGGADPGPGV